MKMKDRIDVIVVEGEDMPDELHLDWSKARANPYAGKIVGSLISVPLDPDVAEVFTTPAAVNKALRALIDAMPSPASSGRAGKTKSGRPDSIPTAGS